jgi:hypothetical protein
MRTSCGWKSASRIESHFLGGTRGRWHAFPGRMRKAIIGTQNEGERGAVADESRMPLPASIGGRQTGRGERHRNRGCGGSGTGAIVAEAPAVEIQRGPADDRPKPARMPSMEATQVEDGFCPRDGINVRVQWYEREESPGQNGNRRTHAWQQIRSRIRGSGAAASRT